MKVIPLGSQGLRVSQVGLGCMNLTGGYSPPPSASAAIALLHRAVDLGVTLFDTAEMYGPFHNEALVGKGLRPLRDRVVIATKFGFDIRGDERRPAGVNSRPAHIRAVCESSLERLNIEYIDLFYQHRVDPEVPIEDVASAVGDLIREGKVRAFGLSEASIATVRRAHEVTPVTAVQTEYSLWSREPEGGLLAACRELGIGFVAYSPLGRGFLAGAGRDMAEADLRRAYPRWAAAALSSNLALVDRLSQVSRRKGCTLAQLSLAWLLRQRPEIVAIPGTSKISRLEENVAASRVHLSAEDLRDIEHAMPAHGVIGDRYDVTGASLIERQ